VTSPIPPFFVFFKKSFLANERENIFVGGPLRSGRCMANASEFHLYARDNRQTERETGERQGSIKGCRASGVNSRRIRAAGL